MSVLQEEIFIQVRTGDFKYAGTDANITIKLHDKHGIVTEKITLDNFFKNDFERERITVENRSTGDVHIFPVFRWLRPHYHYIFKEYDTSLPQDDDHLEQRNLELEEKRKVYEIDQTDPTLPAQVKDLPPDEHFSNKDKWNFQTLKLQLLFQSKINVLTTGKWCTVDDMKNIYDGDVFRVPGMSKFWKEDWFFGYQRINGLCPRIIELCIQIPEKFDVKEKDLLVFLEGNSLQEVLAAKRIFLCDLDIMHDVQGKTDEYAVCVPMALLYVNERKQLMPLAIQLFQEPSTNNPVFLPSDDKYTWLLAKMWYNLAESSYHQSLSHLGFTHLMMEGACLSLHRNVSISHPVFKLLAPHFLYLMQINKGAVKNLLAKDASIDKAMSIGREGVLKLIRKGKKLWKMDVYGTLPENLKSRELEDADVLPGYHYRHDALLVYNAIHKYVSSYVNLYYESEPRLINDTEIQAWAKELVKKREDCGIGMQGVPGNGEFRKIGDLTQALTSIIFTSSVEHAAVNFPQYDYYGFPAVYPATLRGKPPSDKNPRTEVDIVECLPPKDMVLEIMTVGTVLSSRNQKPLGNFEVQYVFDPKAKEIVEQFRDDLRDIGRIITQRNSSLDMPYDYLHPDSIPNSISI